MRIIAGKFKGKILKEFDISSTRPTADIVREAIFDKIGVAVKNKTFLDLFCGTGAVGIEALSRGASNCFFVDQKKEAVSLAKQNLKSINSGAQVFLMDFLEALKTFKKNAIKFDFVFLDPPYASNFAETAIERLKSFCLLNDDAVIIWEHDDTKNDYIANNFSNSQTKRYGRRYVTYIINILNNE